MHILDKWFHRTTAVAFPAPVDEPCVHHVLLPRWERIAEMGKEDIPAGYTCKACRRRFSTEQVRALTEPAPPRLLRRETFEPVLPTPKPTTARSLSRSSDDRWMEKP
jgi:hypothetical protein